MVFLKKILYISFFMFLLCNQTLSFASESISENTLSSNSISDNMLVGSQNAVLPEEMDTAENWQQLVGWMKEHTQKGGSIRLTSDIVMGQNFAWVRSESAEAVQIYLDHYSLTIKGSMEFYGYQVQVYGQGGKEAAMVVSEGSFFYLEAGSFNGIEGPILWQEEGAYLSSGNGVVKDNIHFASQPVAGFMKETWNTIIVEDGMQIENLLPKTLYTQVCFNGTSEEKRLPVLWDLEEEQVKIGIAKRQRVVVAGKLEHPAIFPVETTVTFLNQPITFTNISPRKMYEGILVASMYTLPQVPADLNYQYSYDGKSFESMEIETVTKKSNARYSYYFAHFDNVDDEVVWDLQKFPNIYLRILWEDAPKEEWKYSDMIMIEGATLKVKTGIEGSRGGGINIIDSPAISDEPKIKLDNNAGILQKEETKAMQTEETQVLQIEKNIPQEIISETIGEMEEEELIVKEQDISKNEKGTVQAKETKRIETATVDELRKKTISINNIIPLGIIFVVFVLCYIYFKLKSNQGEKK